MSIRADKPKEYFTTLIDTVEAEIDYSEIPPTAAADWENAEILLPVTVEEFQAIKQFIRSRGEQGGDAALGRVPGRAGIDQEGHIEKGSTLASKTELLCLLETWLSESDASTIGDVGNFGRAPWIFVMLSHGRKAILNADTKRAAVAEYVRHAHQRGSEAPWSVVPNTRNGRFNKLIFREDGEVTPGWYCYLDPPEAGICVL